MSSPEDPLSFREFLDTEMEHLISSTISVVQTSLNTIRLSVHDSNDQRAEAEVHVLIRNKPNVKRVEKHFFPDPAESGPVLVIAPSQYSGRTLCKLSMVPQITTLSYKDGATNEPQRKNSCQSIGKQKKESVVSTPSRTATTPLGSSGAEVPAPKTSLCLSRLHKDALQT